MAFGKVTLKGAVDTIKEGFTAFNTLITDLLATTSGKGASQVGVYDSAGNMAADNVEDALAEIYSDTASTITLAEIFDENTATTTGKTWGYKAGKIRVDNTITSVAAGTIGLTDDDVNYVEVKQDGTVVTNTTSFTVSYIPLRTITVASEVQTVSTDSRAWFNTVLDPVPVTKGGTGVQTLADHGVLLGSGATDVTVTAAQTNGQLLIGKTGSDPSLATLTGTASQIGVTNGGGTITLAVLSRLADLAGLAVTNSNFIVGDGSNFVLESASTARTSMGVAIGSNVQAYHANLADLAGFSGAARQIIIGSGSAFTTRSGILPRSYLAGLQISNNAGDGDQDIDVAVGECRDSANGCDLVLAAGLTKQLDAAFAAGTDAGGLFSGSPANSTGYHVFIIKKDSDDTIDVGFDTSSVATNIPAGYTEYRRLGWIYTDGAGADIYGFTQIGDTFLWDNPFESVDEAAVDQSSAALKTLDVPFGYRVKAMINVRLTDSADAITYLSSPDANDEEPSISAAPLASISLTSGGDSAIANMEIYTNVSGQIRVRGSATADGFDITTLGWIDSRGRDD